MKKITLKQLLFALSLLSISVGSFADGHAEKNQADKAAIKDLLQRTFAAIASGDPEQWRPLLTKKAHYLAFGFDTGSPKNPASFRERAYIERLAEMNGEPTGYLERWIGEPTILVRGPIAVAWGEYEFWENGKFSHCGVDTVNLAKVDGEWKIAHFMWTSEPDGCPDGYPKPLGN